MLTCKEVSRDLAADALQSAGLGRRLAIRAHLLMCDKCSAFVRELDQLGRAIRSLAASSDGRAVDQAATERILKRVRAAWPEG